MYRILRKARPIKQLLLGVVLAAIGAPLLAGAEFEVEFRSWAEQYEADQATFAVVDSLGTVIAEGGSVGPADFSMPIASISKTIAGQCVMHLSRQGRISLDATLGEILDWAAPQGNVKISQLLTHTSGFGPDATQSDILGRNLTDARRIERIIDGIETRALLPSDSALYHYNNENYLVLQAAMTAVLREDAIRWCLRWVPQLTRMESLGPAKTTFALGFAGGLEAAAHDLAMFFHNLVVGEDWPRVNLNARNEYGPGAIIQSVQGGQNIFHLGGICVATGPNFGAFAARLANGNSIAILYSCCAPDTSVSELNSMILRHFGN